VSRKRIIISALRRSGSTIFWRCFRQAAKALCFDEPFNPILMQLPRPHEKNVYGEYVDVLETDSKAFWDSYAPIYSLDELSNDFRHGQAVWLQWLMRRHNEVVIDTTRCWNKVRRLAEVVDGKVYFIHLHRSPAGFAASHLLPSELTSSLAGRWQLFKRRRRFFEMTSGFNYWNMEEITGRGPQSAYGVMILGDEELAERFYSWAAHTRLMYFWKDAYERVEQAGKSAFGDRYMSVSYERFSREPETVLTEVQQRTGLSLDVERLPDVKPSKPVFQEGNSRWYEAAEKAGLEANRQVLFRPQ